MFTRRYTVLNIVPKRFLKSQKADIKEKLTPSEQIWQTLETSNINSSSDWKTVRTRILSSNSKLNPLAIDAMTVGVCTSKKKYDLASSYIEFLQAENIELNLATLGKYLNLLYNQGLEGADNEDQILKLYDNIKKTYPVLDALTLDKVIQALSLTKQWRLCFDGLTEIKKTSSPSASTYSAIISAAFSNCEDKLAWALFNELLEKDMVIKPVIFTNYFKRLGKNTTADIEEMFDFLQRNNIRLQAECIDEIKSVFNKIGITVNPSNVTNKGYCKCCGQYLKTFDLTDSEFIDLKSNIFENVILGKDVFNKTTPTELAEFKEFISKMEKFDIIVDGLNVAYSAGVKQSPLITSGLVAAVVGHFASQNKKVLVLGRTHMRRWPKQNWGFIQSNATLFLTQNLSQDDPYLLYCALNSGKDTIVVSKDLMRGHKFLLRDVHLKSLFDKWFQQRQYQLTYVKSEGVPVFKKPLPFSNIAQKSDGFWHVPYIVKESTANTWVCIKL